MDKFKKFNSTDLNLKRHCVIGSVQPILYNVRKKADGDLVISSVFNKKIRAGTRGTFWTSPS